MEEETKSRIQKAVNIIKENPAELHTLKSLSDEACFSPYHFLRVFKILTGESPGRYIRRERIIRSLNQLIHQGDSSITEIALDSGFSSSANFSKAFKSVMGMNPRQCRKYSYTELVRIAGINTEIATDFTDSVYLELLKEVRYNNLEAQKMLYLRYTGAYNWKIGLSWARFISIMKKHKLFTKDTLLWGIVRDNPDLSKPETCIYDIGATETNPVEEPIPLSTYTFTEGSYAVFPFSGTLEQLDILFAYIYGYWFETVPHVPGEGPVLQHFTSRQKGKTLSFDLFIPTVLHS